MTATCRRRPVRRDHAWVWLFAVVGLVGGRWSGIPPTASAEENPSAVTASDVGQLERGVAELGHPDYARREQAERQLAAAGPAARAVLVVGLHHHDLEIQRRCRAALAVVLDREFRSKLRDLRDHPQGPEPTDLPGWTAYRELVGGERVSRVLFAEMIASEPGVFEALESGSLEAIRWRVAELFYRALVTDVQAAETPGRAALAAMVVASAQPQLDTAEWTSIWNALTSQLQQGEFADTLKDGPLKEPLRALVEAWLCSPLPHSMDNQKLRLAISQGFHEIALARSLVTLERADRRTPMEVAVALECLTVVGGRNYASIVQKSLEDERVVQARTFAQGERQELQVRDIALVLLVDLTEQDVTAYGFKQAKTWFDILRRQQQNRGNLVFNFGNFFPERGTDRAAEVQRWRNWVVEHPLAAAPANPPLVERFRAEAEAGPAAARARRPARRGTSSAGPARPGLQIADREVVNALKHVPDLWHERRFAEGARLLGDILADDQDYCYRLETNGAVFRQIKAWAEQLLAASPEAAANEYELSFGSLARRQLDLAVANNDLAALADVERRYFFTSAGSEAAFLLGKHHWTSGRCTAAALYLERLRHMSRHADRYEPALSTQRSLCWYRAGMLGPAVAALEQLQNRFPDHKLELAGAAFDQPAPGDRLPWLQRMSGGAARVEPQWSVYGGLASGNALATEVIPLVQGDAWIPPTRHAGLFAAIEQLPATIKSEHRTQLPTPRPLIVGAYVVVRTPLAVVAFHRDTGAVAWESRATTNLNWLLDQGGPEALATRLATVTNGMRRRLWDDLAFGAMSTDGRHVYFLEDPGLRLSSVSQWLRVGDDGQREIDEAPFIGVRRLVACDLVTGKIRWQRGGGGSSDDPLAAGRIQSPPLPMGDQLFAVVDLPDQSLLVSLDAATGAIRQQWMLDAAAEDQVVPTNSSIATVPPEGPPTRTSAPSFADGVVVCRTSRGNYVAVDLTRRSIRWTFRPPQPETPPRQRGGRRVPVAVRNSSTEELRSDEWCDAGAVIAEGRAVVSPAEDDRLHCVHLADGALAWSASRLDGLYVAGIADSKVIVVGRSGAHALRLDNGQPAWPAGRREWPEGATPSGRGYVSARRLYVPLTNAEVVVVDLADGQLVARSRSKTGIVPGNLAPAADEVFAWAGQGLHRFDTVTARSNQLAANDDGSSDRQLARAELLVYSGQIEQALSLLADEQRRAPPAEWKRLVAEALLVAPAELLADQLPLAQDIAERLEDPTQRGHLWHRITVAQRQAGHPTAALRAGLQWLDSHPSAGQLMDVTASRQVRRNLLVRAELETLWAAVPDDQRLEFDRIVRERLAGPTTLDALESLGFHPAAHEVRLRLAGEQREVGDPLIAERLLRDVWRAAPQPLRTRAAVELAELLCEQNQWVEAARFYRELSGPLGDVEFRPGQTGRQFAAATPASSLLARYLAEGDLFPRTKPVVDIQANVPLPADESSNVNSIVMRSVNDGSPLAPRVFTAIDQRTRRLFGFDAQGLRHFSVELTTPQNTSILGLQNQGFSECRSIGHLSIAWLGSRVFAIDPWQGGGRILWSRDLTGGDPNRWWRQGQVQRRIQQLAVGGPATSELSSHFVTSHRYVAFQEHRLLSAVDPWTGDTLWVRDDLPLACELLGDGEHVVAVPPDSSAARVYRATDGHELRRLDLALRDKRIVTQGTALIRFDDSDEQARVDRYETTTGNVIWTHKLAKDVRVTAIDDRRLAALDPSGRLIVLALADGSLLLETTLEPLTQLDSLVVIANDSEYYVAANRPEANTNGPAALRRRQPGQLRIDGQLYAIDGRTGKRLWQQAVDDQSLVACHPTESPVLVFTHRRYVTRPSGSGGWTSGPVTLHVTCLDRRTGELLHQAEFTTAVDLSYRLKAVPEQGQFILQNTHQLVTFQYPPP